MSIIVSASHATDVRILQLTGCERHHRDDLHVAVSAQPREQRAAPRVDDAADGQRGASPDFWMR